MPINTKAFSIDGQQIGQSVCVTIRAQGIGRAIAHFVTDTDNFERLVTAFDPARTIVTLTLNETDEPLDFTDQRNLG